LAIKIFLNIDIPQSPYPKCKTAGRPKIGTDRPFANRAKKSRLA